MQHHLAKARQFGLQAVPDPARDDLAGGIGEAVDVVEIMVVELPAQRRERFLEAGEIHHPVLGLFDFALDVDFDPERVAVKPGAFVIRRQIGQPMRRLEGE